MRRIKLMTFALLLTLPIMSQDYTHLVISMNDGQEQSIQAVGTTITFGDGKLTATNGADSVTAALAELQKMYFSNSTGISASSLAEVGGPVEVYSVAGIHLGQFSGMEEARSTLPPGIYVLKSESERKAWKIKF